MSQSQELNQKQSNLTFYHPTWEEWVNDLAEVKPEDSETFIKKTLEPKTMLHIFGRFFFPNIIMGNDEVPEAHLQLIEFMTSPQDGAAIFPRGFAKTTWEKIDCLHDIVYGVEPVILYISATLGDA